ncbi:MAG TPA: patatin-like phospholipase family protein [Pseudomonadales bacterium]
MLHRLDHWPRNPTLRCLLIAVLLSAASAAHAGDQCKPTPTDRKKIGLVLGGGGARGIAHIGVIRVLEEQRVPIDYVAGTSMGSIVGGLYATGMTADQLEAAIRALNWSDIFADSTIRAERPFRRKRDDDLALFGPKFGVGAKSSLLPRGAISGQKIQFFFQTVTSERVQTKDFDALPIPFRAIAADIVTGKSVVISQGDLATAMRASMSIPGLFSPIDFDGRLLVDGGIVNNLPVNVVQGLGADTIIAVDVGTPLSTRKELTDFVSITSQLSGIMVVNNTEIQKSLLTSEDVLIVPDLGSSITSADFSKFDQSIPRGYEAAAALRDRLAPLGLSPAAYAEYRAELSRCAAGRPVIAFLNLDNRSRFSDSVIYERLHVELGQPLDENRLEKDIQQIYALGFLDRATYEVVEEDGKYGLLVTVKQDERGTDFIETGVDFTGVSDSSTIDLRLAYLKTNIDSLGSEFRGMIQLGQNQGLVTELYKPIDEGLKWIVVPKLFAIRRNLTEFNDQGDKLGQTDIEQYGGSFAAGREFWRHAALFGGIRRYTGNTQVRVGDPTTPKSHFEGGEWFVNGTWDRIDNRYFPSRGTFANFEYLWSRQSIGADDQFEQAFGSAFTAKTIGLHTFLLGTRFGFTRDGDAPVQNVFRAGGIFRLSGYEPDELSGQDFGMVLLGYRYKLFATGWVPPYVGMTLEYGNTAPEADDILDDAIVNGSAYMGFNSPLGPLYIGYGFAEGGHRAYFLRIGNILGSSSVGN